MIALKLAFRGMRANRRIYVPNLIATALLVAVNYIILAVTANQSIHHLLFGKQLVILLHLTFELTIIITVAFLCTLAPRQRAVRPTSSSIHAPRVSPA